MLALQLKQYSNKILTNLLSSQFVYVSTQEKPELKKQQLLIQAKQRKKTHYLYLFLTTQQKPYAKKYYASWKSASQRLNAIKSKPKAVSWQIHLPKSKFFANLAYILFTIIPTQTNSEKAILNFHGNQMDLLIPHAPLTTATISLQSKNSYMTDIPITWRWQWTNTSLFQKIFILRHLKVLNQPGLKRLDV